jgi:hypothetical protein
MEMAKTLSLLEKTEGKYLEKLHFKPTHGRYFGTVRCKDQDYLVSLDGTQTKCLYPLVWVPVLGFMESYAPLGNGSVMVELSRGVLCAVTLLNASRSRSAFDFKIREIRKLSEGGWIVVQNRDTHL